MAMRSSWFSSGHRSRGSQDFYERVRDYLSRCSKDEVGFALHLSTVPSKDAERPEGLLEAVGKAVYEARLQG
jgi:hypothetical protein